MSPAQKKGLAWLAATLAAAFLLADGLPFFVRNIPWAIEKRLGAPLGPHLDACGAGRPQSAAALEKLARRLHPLYKDDDFPLTIAVARGGQINAFATLGGRVYIYEGLLRQAQSPEEVAGVLAHEIEHVKRRHILQGAIVKLLGVGVLRVAQFGWASPAELLLRLGFSRDQEREADEGGFERLRDAHVSTQGAARFFERIRRLSVLPAIISDHPDSGQRAEIARRYAGFPAEPALTKEEWNSLRAICGP